MQSLCNAGMREIARQIQVFFRGAVGKNIAALGVLQVANYLIPLIVIPIVVRVLGAELFGRVSYAQNIVTYLTLIVNYGFEYSATRQIALNKENKPKTERIFWSVIVAKLGLLMLSFVLLGMLYFVVPRIEQDWRLYVYTALVNVGVVFFPTWYLQGIQDMSKMAWANFLIKLLGALLVIGLVRQATAYRLYPLLLSLSSIVVGIGALVYVVQHYDIQWRPSSVSTLWDAKTLREVLRAGLPIFINNVFVSCYTTANLTILGAYADDSVLGYFSGAQRIILALNACVVLPVSTAVFPEMSHRFAVSATEGWKYFKRVLLLAGGFALLCSFLTFLFAPLIVTIMLGDGFADSVGLLRWMSPLPFLTMVATILTVQGMYGLGLQRFAPWVGMTLAVICISMNLWLLPRIGVKGVVWSWTLTEVAECLIVGLILHKKGRRLCSTL